MTSFFLDIPSSLKKYAVLKLAVNKNMPDLKNTYLEYIQKHNASIKTDFFPNSGFDLFFPNDVTIPGSGEAKLVSMNVKCEMIDQDDTPSAYYMFPRSSISKTPLLLANHVGIIDSGYRGDLMGAFRSNKDYDVKKDTRLLQICHPSLCPIFVVLVEEHELSTTSRGAGGFGSTGV